MARGVATAIAVFATACASNPSTLQTRAQIIPAELLTNTDFVRYRTVTRADFQAADPPADLSAHAMHLGALLCAAIVPEGEMSLEVERADGDAPLRVAIRGPGYRAAMDRRCSWWNSEQATVPADYVLEHEQIHFGLTEIHARRINREIAELRFRIQSRDEAESVARTRIAELFERATRAFVAESNDFDDATSRTMNRANQRGWMRDVERRLHESSVHAAESPSAQPEGAPPRDC